MPIDHLYGNGSTVHALQLAVGDGQSGLKNVPDLLKKVLEKGAWQERKDVSWHEEIRAFRSFREFVETPLTAGLGTTVRSLQNLCRDRKDVLDLIDRETVASRGNPTGANQHTVKEPEPLIEQEVEGLGNRDIGTVSSTMETKEPDRGNTAQYALRKLRTDAPELHAKVVAGEVSPHRAMVEAGFRKKTYTIPHDPVKTAEVILRTFSPEEVGEIRRLLEEQCPAASVQASPRTCQCGAELPPGRKDTKCLVCRSEANHKYKAKKNEEAAARWGINCIDGKLMLGPLENPGPDQGAEVGSGEELVMVAPPAQS